MALPYNPFLKPALGTPLNQAHSLSLGLVGLWLMNEGSGIIIHDISGNKNHGDFVNAITWVSGKFGPAVDCPGGGANQITIPASPSLTMGATGKQTVLLYFNLDAVIVGSGDNGLINQQAGGGVDPTNISLDTGETEAVQGKVGDTVGTSSVVPNINQWYQIAITYDGTTSRLYLDGILVKIQASTWGSVDGEWQIGKNAGGAAASFFNGQIDHVTIWNRRLAASEIAQLHREPFAMFEPSFNVIESFTPAVGVSIPVMYHHYQIAAGAA